MHHLRRRGELLQQSTPYYHGATLPCSRGSHRGNQCNAPIDTDDDFFLRTGWGESKGFIGGNILKILHGLCQGNGAAPTSWLVLSSVLVTIYKNLGFSSRVESPITRVWLDIMGVLYVDDTDLFTMTECVRSRHDVWEEAQGALPAWGKLLIVTGGLLKPEKCFYYMVDYN